MEFDSPSPVPAFDAARQDSDTALALEWLETDGLGGFSSSTVALANTRGYHAVFNPAVRPPLGRMVLWAHSEEHLTSGEETVPLFARHTEPGVEPEGHVHLARFEAHPIPRWTFLVFGGELVRRQLLTHGRGDAYLAFTWGGPGAVLLSLRPFLAFRDHHDPARGIDDVRRVEPAGAGSSSPGISVRFRGEKPALVLRSPSLEFVPDHRTLENVVLPVETYRGLADREDLWSPGWFRTELQPGETVWTHASLTEEDDPEPFDAVHRREVERRGSLTASFPDGFPGLRPLAIAADQFLVRRGDKNTVIAGYPWFTDWGRDTMIALPGLTLSAGRPAPARELLLTFAAHLRDGLIPNRFPDHGEEPEYNTVDATLWMAVALHHTWIATGDRELVKLLYPVLREAKVRHERGTRHGIRVDADGLLRAGEPGVQLTWMDAKVDDWVVTPRIGKPVEIQALWFNFLRVGAEAAAILDDDEGAWRDAADRVPARFRELFWNADRGYLADLVGDDGEPDLSLRPNQLFALSLPWPLVDEEIALSVLDRTREELLTPRGLRSLSPDHPDYHPRYGGDRRTRDAAYHQGTVWGWLAGPYLEALLRFGGEEGRREVRAWLTAFTEHLNEGCLGQAAEIFDADPPHVPRGCPAQAWTAAEMLRIVRLLADDRP